MKNFLACREDGRYMDTIDSLFSHLEHLDSQLAAIGAHPDKDHHKLIKEVLLTRYQIRQHLQWDRHSLHGTAAKGNLERINAQTYNIDTINSRFLHSIVCPRCENSDVAVIKPMPPQQDTIAYDKRHNRRLKLVLHESTPSVGRFSCNSCLTRFNPALPPHIVKLCEMLFTYY
jgi:hypothetical protein